MLVWNLLCVFSSAQFGASLRFTTDLKSSLCPPVWQLLSLPPPNPSLHTCDLVNGSQSKKERKEKKRPFLPHDDCRPHYRLFRGGGRGVGRCLCYFFLEKKEIMLCAGAGRSWLSAVLGNHLSLYWFRCLSLLVPVTPFVDRPRLWRFEPQAAKKKTTKKLNKIKRKQKNNNFTVTFGD